MWNAIGPLVGVLIGVLLTPWITWRWQHKQWSLDNKKLEYRELVDGLFQATEEIIKARPNVGAGWNQAVTNAAWGGTRLVQNRIFIARSIRDASVPADWYNIVNVAQWEPGEPKIEVNGQQYSYTTNAISILRNNLEQKLLAIIQTDLGL
jgi:hypothetical protein